MSKTFLVIARRLGNAIAAPGLTKAIRKTHDFLTVGATTLRDAGFQFDAPEGACYKGFIKGPKAGGGIRDLAWDGEHLLVVYSQDSTVYKLKISE